MEQYENYKDYCRTYILNNLEDFKGRAFYDSYELAREITYCDNVTGSFTYSTYLAKEYIKEWFNDLGEVLEDYEAEMGEPLNINPFNEAERFHAVMVILGVEKMLSELNTIPQDLFRLTEALIKDIVKELNDLELIK